MNHHTSAPTPTYRCVLGTALRDTDRTPALVTGWVAAGMQLEDTILTWKRSASLYISGLLSEAQQTLSCLLYTSDAADDWLVV